MHGLLESSLVSNIENCSLLEVLDINDTVEKNYSKVKIMGMKTQILQDPSKVISTFPEKD